MAGGLKRLATAAVGLPVFFVVIKFLHPWVFLALVCTAGVLATFELNLMARCRGIHGDRLLGAIFTVAVVLSFADERVDLATVLVAAVILVPLRRLLSLRGVDGALESTAVTLMGIVFLGMTLGYMILLMGSGGEMGRDLTVLLFLVVWISDAGAFYVGSTLGRMKLAPRISPNKTVEGALGGLIIGTAAAWVAKLWFFHRLGVPDVFALGALLWASGMAGDLVESLLKRSAAVKDCGTLFPGHGGMLDRTDSLLFGAPVLFYYYQAFMA
jgi:phosphatidate cytidylyltransferase